ncbi:hypothetical protein TspCOW1_09900 [Thiohalobacter sp. COW1]|uniref:choice-of-anchor O protein n=1 Tax=Thiohalobacter sp. COW1 TaxID=2795687 RepID=UPI001914EC56|nr:choice-of-anchor O protein [Thiohalobacter sp. COW1]BCO30887.1 hypothetical protein TspCOW1_09900 [Thiohalobacter sp. COW1]
MAHRKTTLTLAVSAVLATTAAYALTQLAVEDPITISSAEPAGPGAALGTGANKSKLFRHRNGMLVAVYGDYVSPPGGVLEADFQVYDLKAQDERPPRDLFVRTCDSLANSCLEDAHWTAPVNISQSATQTSISTNWRGNGPEAFYGDAEKPNGFINPNGVTVVSWVSHYCPGGDQRARLYIERDSRIIPFTCTWVAHSEDYGQTWQPAVQLSTGERAAKQDVNRGTTAFWAVTWQEDPTGLELGEAEGPGDGASGANVSGGTDIWYSWTTVTGGTTLGAWNAPVRVTDNHDGTSFGTEGSLPIVFDGANTPVDDGLIEKGQAGASRSNLGSVGSAVIMGWEETKGSQGLDEGKFIRYLTFPATTPPTGEAGCILSDPTKNARRVRFVTQSPTDAGAGGMQIGIFWKEGINTQGGPSDIMFRRGIDGIAPANMQPAVSPGCAVSDYATTQTLFDNGHVRAENISSQTKDVAAGSHDNLLDDTEDQFTENALAHRGLLRGNSLWLGYNYTENLALLTYLNMDNYNFWIRKFSWDSTAGAGTWSAPQQISQITDTEVIAREPRLVGTPPDGDSCATEATECRNSDVFYVAWGSQTNVSPWAPEEPEELGLSITRTTDGGATFEPVTQLSVAQGLFGGPLVDEETESAFESQLQVRPDGNKLYGVWNQIVSDTETLAKFTTAVPTEVDNAEPAPAPSSGGGGGGCTLAGTGTGFDPLLPGVALAGLVWLGLRRRAAHSG